MYALSSYVKAEYQELNSTSNGEQGLTVNSQTITVRFLNSADMRNTTRISRMIYRGLCVKDLRFGYRGKNAHSHRHRFWAKWSKKKTLLTTFRQRHKAIERIRHVFGVASIHLDSIGLQSLPKPVY